MKYLDEEIHSRWFKLRRLTLDNAKDVFEVYASDPLATKFVTWPTHVSIKETKKFLRTCQKNWDQNIDRTYGIFLKPKDQLAGSIGIINNNGRVEIGYILGRQYWGKGIIPRALKIVLKRLKRDKDIFRIGAYVQTRNKSSIRVLEKCGFKKEGLLKNWIRIPNQRNKPVDCYSYCAAS